MCYAVWMNSSLDKCVVPRAVKLGDEWWWRIKEGE
jgi:hypothetical protein